MESKRDTAARNSLRQHRLRSGLSQIELAAAASVTRQTLSAIEAGRVSPSVEIALRLARALGASVEELFAAPAARAELRADASERLEGRVAAAFVGGRWVAHGLAPEDAARSADAIARHGGAASVALELLHEEPRAREVVLLAGCAPALGVLAGHLGARRGPGIFRWLPRSSTDSLTALAHERVHCAGVHLVDARTGEPSLAEVRRRARSRDLLVVTLARWSVGLIVRAGNPKRIRDVGQLVRPRIRVAAREPGSGAQQMLERELVERGLEPSALRPALEVRGQLEAARAVALGAADVGPGSRDAARSYGLGFVELGEERFDLVLPAASREEPRIQRLIETLSSGAWRTELSALGYDAGPSGEVAAHLRAA